MARAFHQILDDYEQYLRVEKNLSERTRRAYLYDLKRFHDRLAGPNGRTPAVARIDAAAIREYLNHLQLERAYKSATLARTIASIRLFFEFCVLREDLAASPAARIHNPKHAKKLPIYLVKHELARLLAAPDRSDPAGARDAAILTMLAFTGCRLSELVGLNVGDLSLEQKSMRVLGKGAKERIVPLNQVVLNAIDEYLNVRQIVETNALFLNRRGGRLSGRSVENVVRKHVLAAGVFKDRISPHKLRHTFATLLHASDVDILEIQSLLGHASITSTQIYTHTSNSRLRAAVNKLEGLDG